MTYRGARIGVLLGVGLLAASCGHLGDPQSDPPIASSGHNARRSNALPATANRSASLQVDSPVEADAPANRLARSATLAFTGDTLAHSPLWRRAAENAGGAGFDFSPMFAAIAQPISTADLAVCHLETPIAPVGEEHTTFPLYGVPAEVVTAIADTGYDRCSTASNHVVDRGVAGIDRTVAVLEAHGLAQSGMARTPAEIEPTVFVVDDIVMSHLSYTFGTNGIPLPAGEPWRSALIDPARIIADARTARDLGAEFVFVSLHWGEERRSTPTDDQVAVAEQLTESGLIDLIVGHHAHVVQPIERVNGVWVAYGTGNILSNLPTNDTWPASTQDAVIVSFDVIIDEAGRVAVARPKVRPTWVDKNAGWVIRDVLADLAGTDVGPATRAELRESLGRTRNILGEYFDTTGRTGR